MAYVQGGVTSLDRGANQHPLAWESSVFQRMIRSRCPITAFLDIAPSETTEASTFNWAEDDYEDLSGATTGVYDGPDLATAVGATSAVGTPVYLAVTAADAGMARTNDTITLVNTAAPAQKVNIDVRGVSVTDDANSYISGVLLEADGDDVCNDSAIAWFLSGEAEGALAELPTAIYKDPTWYFNYCQRMGVSAEVDGREMKEKDRTNPKIWARALARSRWQMQMKRERTVVWGTRVRKANDKTFTGGLEWFLQTYHSGNILDYRTDTTYHATAGATWLEGGWDFTRNLAEYLSRNTDSNAPKNIYCGSLAVEGFNRLIEDRGQSDLKVRQTDFGIAVRNLHGLNQEWRLIEHADLTAKSYLRNSMIIMEPGGVRRRYMAGRDLSFISPSEAMTNGYTWVDGRKAGWWVDEGYRWNKLESMAIVHGVGLDRA